MQFLQEDLISMQRYTFSYTEAFHCIAGKCPDSCCKGWEIVVDPETLQTYQQTSAPIGATIRKALTKNEDDEWIFQNREDGNCPFWNTEKLCDLQIQAGEHLLCDTCRNFPRIPQDYTLFTEHVLSLACPEAARLVLTQTEPFQAIPLAPIEESSPIKEEDLPYSLNWMNCLLETRAVLLQLFQETSIPLSDALCYGLHYAEQFQDWIEEKTDDFPELQPIPSEPAFLHHESVQHLYKDLEWMTPEWADWMRQIQDHPVTDADLQAFTAIAEPLIPAFRNFCSYYLYLYWLQALNTGNALIQYQKLLAALQEIALVSAWKLRETHQYSLTDCMIIVQRYAKEVMHDAENIEKIEDILYNLGNLSIEN